MLNPTLYIFEEPVTKLICFKVNTCMLDCAGMALLYHDNLHCAYKTPVWIFKVIHILFISVLSIRTKIDKSWYEAPNSLGVCCAGLGDASINR